MLVEIIVRLNMFLNRSSVSWFGMRLVRLLKLTVWYQYIARNLHRFLVGWFIHALEIDTQMLIET
jgi:hypothetical protein